jgi:hypothetical protein
MAVALTMQRKIWTAIRTSPATDLPNRIWADGYLAGLAQAEALIDYVYGTDHLHERAANAHR